MNAAAFDKPVRTSGLAITSLVLGILSILAMGVTALPGLIFGIIGLVQTGKQSSRLAGRGLAMAGVITSSIGLVVFGIAVMAALLFPVFAKAREKARLTQCISNQKQITVAILMWTQDHNGTLPQTTSFSTDMKPYIPSDQIFTCPTASASEQSYGYNNAVGGKSIRGLFTPDNTILFADGGDSNGILTNESDIVFRHAKTASMGYADGHVAPVHESAAPSLAIPTH